MDLIDAKLDAQAIAEENPDDWKRLAADIAKTLEQDESMTDPRRRDIEQARQLARAMILDPEERIAHARKIERLLTEAIAERSRESQVAGMA